MRIRFNLVLALLGLSLAFSSCDEDDADDNIDITGTTWGANSDEYNNIGITLELKTQTFEYTQVDFDGRVTYKRGTFSNVQPYDAWLQDENGTQLGRIVEKGDYLEFSVGAIAATELGIPSDDVYRLEEGVQGTYVAMPSTLSIAVEANLDFPGENYQNVTLSWESVANAEKYSIFRTTTSTPDERPIFNSSATPYLTVDSTVTSYVLPQESATTEYYYFVGAYTQNATVDADNTLSGGINSASGLMGAPAGVRKLAETVGVLPTGIEYYCSGGVITLSWDSDFQNTSYNVYQKYRSEDTVVATVIATGNSEETVVISTDVVTGEAFISGETYDFYITGVNSAGLESAISASADVSANYFAPTASFTLAADEDGIQTLYWSDVEGISTYKIYESPTTSFLDASTTTVGSTGALEITVSSLSGLSEYRENNLFVAGNIDGEASSVLSVNYAAKTVASFTADTLSTDTVAIVFTQDANDTEDTEYLISWSKYDQVDGAADDADFNDAASSRTVTYSDADGGAIIIISGLDTDTKNGLGYRFYLQTKGVTTDSDAIIDDL